MNKPKGYDETIVGSNFRKLPKGGYICKIMKIEEGKSKATGADQLLIYLDIAEGEYKDIFGENYRNSTSPLPKWGCVAYQPILDSTTGATNPRFKAFLTAVEESNPGFVVDKTWGDDFVKFYKSKYIGFVFGDEHYISTKDGKEKTIAKPRFAVSTDKIKKGDFMVPEDTYSGNFNTSSAAPTAGFNEVPSKEVDDDDVPF